ncbi:glycosyltransferase family 9 protein [bacterium]|nr:glycosyltransferase family 9 protein [bacterium]
MARLGDIIQMLPLLESLPVDENITLICDAVVSDWAELLPNIGEIRPIDTALWRSQCIQGPVHLPEMLSELRELSDLDAGEFNQVFALNDHSATDALTALYWFKSPHIWLTSELLLMRSYLRAMAWFRPVGRIHLADLWRYLAKQPTRRRSLETTVPEKGTHFAKNVLSPLYQQGLTRIFAFLLGSGGHNRRISPQTWAGYWNAIQQHGDIGLVLLGAKSELSVADGFYGSLYGNSQAVLNLIGKTSPLETLGVLKEIDGIVSVDTGPLHWAAALKTPLVGIYFAEAGLYETGPYGQNHWALAPSCRDYPCSSAMAERCQYQCRSYFEETTDMGNLIYTLLHPDSTSAGSLPQNIELYRSYSQDGENHFRNLSGLSDHPEAENLARYCKGILQDTPEIRNGPIHAHPLLDKFYETWTAELTTLPLPLNVPMQIRENQRKTALRRLQTMKPPQPGAKTINQTLQDRACASYC